MLYRGIIAAYKNILYTYINVVTTENTAVASGILQRVYVQSIETKHV